jgi:hypothetical protein
MSIAEQMKRVRDALRWRQLLRSCRIDPDTLGVPVAEPGPSDFIICGLPRSGTSLLAGLLFQPPQVVVCMEPWDGLRLPPHLLFKSIRQEIAQTGKLSRGRLEPRALERRKVEWKRDGEVVFPIEVDPDYLLSVKWPGFWRYLPVLTKTKFLVCVRDPVEVIRSFAKTGGRLSQGLEYDVAFHRRMNQELADSTSSAAVRRALLYEYIASRIAPHLDRAQVLTVRYERWSEEPARLLGEISEFLGLSPPLRMTVDIEESPQPPRDPQTVELIRQYSPSALALGYPV